MNDVYNSERRERCIKRLRVETEVIAADFHVYERPLYM
jgi:hypothetical protein